MAAALFWWLVQLHKDVPMAAKLYSKGLDFSVNICTLRWTELQSGALKLALMQSPCTVTKLMALGAELDGPIKYEINGKAAAMRSIDGHMIGFYEPS